MTVRTPRIGMIRTICNGHFGDTPARSINEPGAAPDDLTFEIADLRDYPMPLFGDPENENRPRLPTDAVQRGRARMGELDGYSVVTGEYSLDVPSTLENAPDHLYAEYSRNPASFIGYGGVGGARAVEQVRLIAVELQIASPRNAVHIRMDALLGVAQQGKGLADHAKLTKSANAMLHELLWWTQPLTAAQEQGVTTRVTAERSAS